MDSVKLYPSGLVLKSFMDFVEADPKDGVIKYIKSYIHRYDYGLRLLDGRW